MLQNIRDNSQSWIVKVLIGLIIMLLALTGVEAIFSSTSHQQDAAQVNGEPITRIQLQQAVQAQRNQLLQQLGAGFDASLLRDDLLQGSALNGLIDRILLIQGARDSGFGYSQRALDQVILETPEFQVNGQFSAARFDQMIQQMGYNRLQFRQLLEEEMLIGQLRAGISGTAFVTDRQLDAFIALEKQTRDFSMQRVSIDPASITPSDEELADYYKRHAAEYMSPEQVVVDYIKLKKDSLFDQVPVDESRLQALYDEKVAALAEQRHAAHILIEITKDQDETAAKAQAEELRSRLEKGEAFADLAKSFSKDSGSAAEGGDLGFAGPGVYDPAFEDALYALKEGEVSAPVRTQFGWHLIKLLGVQAPDKPDFETLKPDLVRELKSDKVEQRFVELTKQLETAAYESADLAQPAQEFGLSIETSQPFGRAGGDDIAANPQVVSAAFSAPVLEEGANSALLELDPETVLVLRRKEHKKSEQMTLEQVKDRVLEAVRLEKAKDKTREEGEALLAKLRQEPFVLDSKPEAKAETKAVESEEVSAASTPEATTEASEAVEAEPEVAAVEPSESSEAVVAEEKAAQVPQPQGWQHFEAVSRVQEGVAREVLKALFALPKPTQAQPATFGSLTLPTGDFVVLRLEGVSAPKDALTDAQRQDYRRLLMSRQGQQDFAAYMNGRRATAEIERF